MSCGICHPEACDNEGISDHKFNAMSALRDHIDVYMKAQPNGSGHNPSSESIDMKGATEVNCSNQNPPANPEQDPAFTMYREWKSALAEWRRLADTDDWNAPHMVELSQRYLSIEDAVSETKPETAPQAALLAIVVWENEGSPLREDSPEYQKSLEVPRAKALLSLKEWAESVLES